MAIRSFLAENPEAGDVVPGLDGMRKLRWTESRRNKGKRGGTRHIYFYAVSAEVLLLLDAYSKGVKEDLSMPTGKNSDKRSTSSKKRSAAADQTTERGKRLVESVNQAAAYLRGERPLRTYTYNVPGRVDVRAVREKTGLSQSEFAATYALSPRTLQQWEQGRSEPDLAVRAYLTVIDRNPEAVLEALAAGAK